VYSEETYVEIWQTTEAGRHFRTLLDEVRRGEWQLVGDRGQAEAVFADAEELSDLIGAGYRFRPKTAFGDQGAEIWLPEVETHVVGATLEEARRDLAEAMLKFASDWQAHVRQTAEQTLKAGYARRIQLAGDQAGVLAMLDRDARAESVVPTSARLSPESSADQPRRWMGPRDRLAALREAQADHSASAE
jgi:hypothetical protein